MIVSKCRQPNGRKQSSTITFPNELFIRILRKICENCACNTRAKEKFYAKERNIRSFTSHQLMNMNSNFLYFNQCYCILFVAFILLHFWLLLLLWCVLVYDTFSHLSFDIHSFCLMYYVKLWTRFLHVSSQDISKSFQSITLKRLYWESRDLKTQCLFLPIKSPMDIFWPKKCLFI